MFTIQALHPDGWREQGSANLEYWACQEAQTRCCSDGRNYRVLHADSKEIVALIDSTSCRFTAADPAPQQQRGADRARR